MTDIDVDSSTDTLRFGGINRLYGNDAAQILANAHLCVIGIGGVGSWTAEALARSGVGQLTLIDLDDICVTNTNRQIHATADTIGQDKTAVMAERIRAINPACQVNCIEDFVTEETQAEYLLAGFDCVIDAIDSVNAKTAMIAFCKRNKIPLITVGGAGGQTDPRLITSGDLAKTFNDPLLAKVRNNLRRKHNFTKNTKRKFGIEAVFSEEQLVYPQADGSVCQTKAMNDGSTRLDCAGGFGAATMVTATFGFIAAARAVDKVLAKARKALLEKPTTE
ncbi:tRNA cyclic N6-threonylcarbamoyladenosine(37) synthase TcdA [Corallincola spongiicola]|uniref:tRNA cyclic N6-threonylcarbamoyladenosine(37) synthase TcdA n=1 Tax=Corallincola spongiicola TaxID=2520508 RepID=A0ABY1WMP8_9GAMM|nr:tRNA cyclic N6-threonylcarbamoyladenosine(37) synthase TcdA [Corallincola spongiicola]TAA43602.1 tRNA cyclic N6-threonylcarbamoyladenosine(37) synthase TcdA [Corallincola spongiicola]